MSQPPTTAPHIVEGVTRTNAVVSESQVSLARRVVRRSRVRMGRDAFGGAPGRACGSVAHRAERGLARLLEGEELNSRGDPGGRARRNSCYSRLNEHSPAAGGSSVEKLAIAGAGVGAGGPARRPGGRRLCSPDRDSAARPAPDNDSARGRRFATGSIRWIARPASHRGTKLPRRQFPALLRRHNEPATSGRLRNGLRPNRSRVRLPGPQRTREVVPEPGEGEPP